MKSSIYSTIIIFLLISKNEALNSFEKIKNQCYTMAQFEGLYPEYAQKSLSERFNTEKIIGKGSFGKVIIGNLNNKEIVIKNVHIPNDTYALLVSRELKFLEKVKNQPHLLQYYLCVYNEKKASVYIFTEKLYKDLIDLRKKLKSQKKSERLKMYMEIAKSIKELHELKIIHQDIKPDNIMVTNEQINYPKLIDFGLSTRLGNESIGGSPLYSAFEKLDNSDVFGYPSLDVVSFGVSICVLEIGKEMVSKYAKIANLKEYKSLENFHYSIISKVNDFNVDLETPNFFGKFCLWIKSIFINVKKDKVLNFKEFLMGLMENDVNKRFTIDEAIYILNRFFKFYQKLDNKSDNRYLNVV